MWAAAGLCPKNWPRNAATALQAAVQPAVLARLASRMSWAMLCSRVRIRSTRGKALSWTWESLFVQNECSNSSSGGLTTKSRVCWAWQVSILSTHRMH